MGELRDLQHIPQNGGHSDADWDDVVSSVVERDRRHQLIVTLLKHQERAFVLIRLILTLDNLITSLIHAEHTHHVSEIFRLNGPISICADVNISNVS